MKDWGQLAITSEKPMFLLCILEFYDANIAKCYHRNLIKLVYRYLWMLPLENLSHRFQLIDFQSFIDFYFPDDVNKQLWEFFHAVVHGGRVQILIWLLVEHPSSARRKALNSDSPVSIWKPQTWKSALKTSKINKILERIEHKIQKYLGHLKKYHYQRFSKVRQSL